MPPITTVIFDMYDTLVRNNGNLWDITFAKIIQDQGLSVTTEQLLQEWRVADTDFRDNRIQPGRPFESYYDAWESSFTGAFAALDLKGDAKAATDQVFTDLSRRDPFPETIEAIRQLQSSYRTAVLSNADDGYLFPVVDRLGLKFERVLSSEAVQVYKPEPGVFHEMIKELGIRPEEAAYIATSSSRTCWAPAEWGCIPCGSTATTRLRTPNFPRRHSKSPACWNFHLCWREWERDRRKAKRRPRKRWPLGRWRVAGQSIPGIPASNTKPSVAPWWETRRPPTRRASIGQPFAVHLLGYHSAIVLSAVLFKGLDRPQPVFLKPLRVNYLGNLAECESSHFAPSLPSLTGVCISFGTLRS